MFLHVLNNPRVDCALESVVAMCVLLLGRALNAQVVAGVVVVAGTFTGGIGLRECALHGNILCGQEDNLDEVSGALVFLLAVIKTYLRVGGLCHCLHSLEVSDLHGGSRRQNISGLSHVSIISQYYRFSHWNSPGA